MIADAKQVAPERPFFMYFCPGANHAPHQPPKEWADKYKGTFDMGYEKIRDQILANQKKMGIVPGNTELGPMNPLAGLTSVDGKQQSPFDLVRPWDSLSEDEKAIMVRMAEVYAGLCSYTDHEIGRLIDYLERTGELDNTLIVWISDNGASGEGGPDGSINGEFLLQRRAAGDEGQPRDAGQARFARDVQPLLDRLGDGVQHPVQDVQAPHLGGRRRRPDDRALAQGHQSQGRAARSVHALLGHRADGLRVPGHRPARGRQGLHPVGSGRHQLQVHVRRRERRDPEGQPVLRHARYRAIWRDGWKAEALHAGAPSDWSHFAEDRWALYHVQEDRSECHDLAAEHPELLNELIALCPYRPGSSSGCRSRTAPRSRCSPRHGRR